MVHQRFARQRDVPQFGPRLVAIEIEVSCDGIVILDCAVDGLAEFDRDGGASGDFGQFCIGFDGIDKILSWHDILAENKWINYSALP